MGQTWTRGPEGVTLPASLERQARWARLEGGASGGIPALVVHPGFEAGGGAAPVVVWMHGRTVNKELDTGRYLRLARAGVATVAIDLPGHGERGEMEHLRQPRHTLELLERALGDVDRVIEALHDPWWERETGARLDVERMAIGGMSAGGMVALRRLCEDHPFVCSAVESAAGDLGMLYGMGGLGASAGVGPEEAGPRLARLDPMLHAEGWRPVPLLALHSEADRVVPVGCVRGFIERVGRGSGAGVEVRLHTWPQTGAPDEHAGFGRVAAEAKGVFVGFVARWLGVG